MLLCLPKLDYLPVLRQLPPVGVAYVSASLKKAGFKVFTFNANLSVKRSLAEELSAIISANDIAVIGVGGLFCDYAQMSLIIDSAKEIRPDIVAFIGGGLVTHSPYEAMRLLPSADIGVIGEGEITCRELMQALESGTNLLQVPGLILRIADTGGATLTLTKRRSEIADIEALPWPDYEGFGMFEIYPDSPYGAVTTSRSCPYKCTFCAHSGGLLYRQRSLNSIFAEIEYLIEHYKISKLSLNDELFSVDPHRMMSFCRRISPYGMRWRAFLRASGAYTPEFFAAMRDCGCEALYFGLESADNRVLKSMHKMITVEDIEHTLTLTKQAGIHTTGAFIFGDARETLETAHNSIDWVFSHRHILDWAIFEPIVLYPGSQLYRDAARRGKIADTTEFIRRGCPLTNVSALTEDEYQRLVQEILPAANQRLREDALEQYAQTGKMVWLP